MVILGVVAFMAWMFLAPESPMNRASAIKATCEWARLNPLPVIDSEVRITTNGSMFTREFIIGFEGAADKILAWLQASPGTASAFAKRKVTEGDAHLEISPGGGAAFAEITISQNGRHVRIRAYWS